MKITVPTFFAILLLVSMQLLNNPSTILADTGPPSFDQGIHHFRRGEYPEALASFQKAWQQGVHSGQLMYNMGVCYYRIGEYHEAEQAFSKAAEYNDIKHLANYNRGLAALKVGEEKQAYELFTALTEQHEEPKLARLAEVAIDRKGLAEKFASSHPWISFFSFGTGYDDNVRIISESDISGASGNGDAFSELMLFARGPLARDSNLHAQLYFYTQKYIDLDEYDTATPGVGVSYVKTGNSREFETGLQYRFTFLGHERHEQTGTASVKFTRKFSKTFTADIQYAFSVIDMLDPLYDYLDTTRNRIEIKGTFTPKNWRISLGCSLELNDTDDKRYAPTRSQISSEIKYSFTGKSSAALSGLYRYSVYDYPKGEPDREEDFFKAAIDLSHRLSNSWTVDLSYSYYDNNARADAGNSSIYDTYDYERAISMISFSKLF